MALSSPDPIMSTFELRQEMKKLAQVEKEFKVRLRLHTHRYNHHFPDKTWLATWPHDSHSPVTLILSSLNRPNTVHTFLFFDLGK